MNIQEKGRLGETIAKEYLLKNGYDVVKLNYHSRYGEIDIIATNEKYIIFVEVKTRKTESMVSPVEAVNSKKQEKIIKTAIKYLIDNNIKIQPRFDIIEIFTKNKGMYIEKVNHIENAFYMEGSYAPF